MTPSEGTSAVDRDVREDPVYRLKAELFRTLGHPARVRLLELLGERERTVGELQDALELDSSGASQHLSVLRRQGLIDGRKVGTSVVCRVKDARSWAMAGREASVRSTRDSGGPTRSAPTSSWSDRC